MSGPRVQCSYCPKTPCKGAAYTRHLNECPGLRDLENQRAAESAKKEIRRTIDADDAEFKKFIDSTIDHIKNLVTEYVKIFGNDNWNSMVQELREGNHTEEALFVEQLINGSIPSLKYLPEHITLSQKGRNYYEEQLSLLAEYMQMQTRRLQRIQRDRDVEKEKIKNLFSYSYGSGPAF